MMVFELITYTDNLLHEVGLSSHRKSWLKDIFAPTRATDLTGLKDEYVGKYYDDAIKVNKVSSTP